MEKSEFRVLIKHYFLRRKTIKETKEKLDKYYGDSAPSDYMVKYWFAKFKRGRLTTDDEPRPGRPVEVATEENITKIHKLVLADRRVKLSELAETTGISKESIRLVLHDKLHLKKLSARWVPRLLTVDQKRERVEDSETNLALFKRDSKEFLRRYITVDETWIHFYTPESTQATKQWTEAGGSAPKRPKSSQSAGKVMATVFWDAHGIVSLDFLEKGKTITGQYYAELLDKLNDAIRTKRPHLAGKKVLFHQDNAPAHNSMVAMAKLHQLRYELLPHPPYSPDLAPSDFFLFPNLKRYLRGKRFYSNAEVIAETTEYFASFEKSYYSDGIGKLQDRWNKCITLKGDYVEE